MASGSGKNPSKYPRERFTRGEILRLLDLTEKQLEYWERLRLVQPKKGRGERFYDFRDLISLRTTKQLIEQGVPAQRLRRALVALEQKLSEVQAPLTELRIVSNGRDILVEHHGARMEPFSGQLAMNFETRELDHQLRVMPERTNEDWLGLAAELEADPNTREEAIDAYQQALAKNPNQPEAVMNLGALLYEQGHFEAAADCFRLLLRLEPDSPVAHYNLGSVLEELGRLDAAYGHLRQAVMLKPDYADAHYNLALVCEKMEVFDEARQHWKRYIELDPTSPWASYARERLTPFDLPSQKR
jgi:tetratricopeptide (TPR) repeat protein